MAVVESENFAIYSNIDFLYLIGKFAAQSRQCSEQGLRSLNDYLLILDHTRETMNEREYTRKRCLALYQVGIILHSEKEQAESLKYFLLAAEDL